VPSDAIDPALAKRLRAAGVDPDAPGDPAAAFRLLRERFGRRGATLVDRYALEAAARGVAPEALELDVRDRLTHEVLREEYPGLEWASAFAGFSRDPIEVVEADPAWPARFDEWRDRIRGALGSVALRIDHVGSTAVAGLAAKPVIDVQVSVKDANDEASYVPALETLGLSLRSRDTWHRYLRPAAGAARVVHVHVCSAGSDWERDHLLFRDYLRAHPDAAAAYGRLKSDLATRWRGDRIAYTEAKTAFILDALDSAASTEA
jgi:GrpB-like predicted nucleotidyltransferase (UPF0157 family)